MRAISDGLPEATQALTQRLRLDDLEPIAFALRALTALGGGEGRVLTLEGKELVIVLAARNGTWDERSIGKTVSLGEEPFALRAMRARRLVVAPLGLIKGTEPIAHTAAFIPASIPLVLTLDLPLWEVCPIALWRVPRSLLAQIAQAAWGDKVPCSLLPWALQGRKGVAVWDAEGRQRWGDEVRMDFQDLRDGLTITVDAVWLKTPVGTKTRSPFFSVGSIELEVMTDEM